MMASMDMDVNDMSQEVLQLRLRNRQLEIEIEDLKYLNLKKQIQLML